MLTRDQILGAEDLEKVEVEVPEWGGSVLVWAMTGTERDAFEQSLVDMRGKSQKVDLVNIRARLAVLCLKDEDGNRLFADNEVELLGQKSGAALDRIFPVAQRLSGVTDDDVEELAGNSESEAIESIRSSSQNGSVSRIPASSSSR